MQTDRTAGGLHPVEPTTRRTSFIEVFNTIGSAASVTGISLLWLRDLVDWGEVAFFLPAYTAIIALAIGLFALCFLALRGGFDRWARRRGAAWQVVYWSFAIPIAIGALSLTLAGATLLVRGFMNLLIS